MEKYIFRDQAVEVIDSNASMLIGSQLIKAVLYKVGFNHCVAEKEFFVQNSKRFGLTDVEKWNKIKNINDILRVLLTVTNDRFDTMYEKGETILCGNYKVKAEHRLFDKWTNVLEIVPLDMNGVGYSDAPAWMAPEECMGTRTANLPPDFVVEQVFSFIKIKI